MHELSIALSIVDIAKEEAKKSNAETIKEIELEIGKMSGVDKDALLFSLNIAMKNSVLDGARIELKEIVPLAYCRACHNEYVPDTLFSACPKCHSYGSELIKGREMRVKSLLVE
ncbi:hydrogenase maturation nickel metallochaperone HypA [Coprobacter tertius]|uniref:Hydrogenase maturation factor HypA n=1 Tax=Coprobacter tertius TaxID=2944915 RepID=A0ABT1MJS0_9BACT|nr:hydrogenase maturation nickel metallochaperone HypA [Coprobacter tertius]MCP9612116.1 hydrogenase maturation nickel metallochaperone HypA [Coprobacter tertius]